MSRGFILVSRWSLHAPVDAVWELLRKPEEWPEWWPYLRAVSLLHPGGDEDLGARRRFVWGSLLGYGLTFDITTTRVLRHRELEGNADGDVNGIGTWRLAPHAVATEVNYRWQVELGKRWMRLAAPHLAPVFAWNHHGVMRAGARGMASRLGCRLEGYAAVDAAR